MAKLKPVKLHIILGTSTVWTDELWAAALYYLLDNIGTLDALAMAEILFGDERPNYLHKIDYLREFRAYPPTTLLGAFDYMRAHKTRSVATTMTHQ